MIRYKHPITGADIVTSSDGAPKEPCNIGRHYTTPDVKPEDVVRLPDPWDRRVKKSDAQASE